MLQCNAHLFVCLPISEDFPSKILCRFGFTLIYDSNFVQANHFNVNEKRWENFENGCISALNLNTQPPSRNVTGEFCLHCGFKTCAQKRWCQLNSEIAEDPGLRSVNKYQLGMHSVKQNFHLFYRLVLCLVSVTSDTALNLILVDLLKRLSLQLRTFSKKKIFSFKSFVKAELS